MPADVLVLTAADVARLLAAFPPPALLAQSARLFRALAQPGAAAAISQPHRTSLALPSHTVLVMPARVPPAGAALKLVGVPSAADDTRGLPASTVVLDERTGAVRALVNARALTAARTAAGTALATALLHPPETAKFARLVAFGAGAQVRAHVELLCALYPSITHVTLVARSANARAEGLAAHLRSSTSRPCELLLAADERAMHAAVHAADVIVTATPATAPLFPSSAVRAGAHLILVGSWRPDMHEVDAELVRRAGRVVLDSRAACAAEAGELIDAAFSFERAVEFGELVRDVQGEERVLAEEALAEEVRKSGDVTLVKSVGVGGQDVAIARAVVDLAEKMGGVGTLVRGYDDV